MEGFRIARGAGKTGSRKAIALFYPKATAGQRLSSWEGLLATFVAAVCASGALSFERSVLAACSGCTSFDGGVAIGRVESAQIGEASGIAVSQKNPGVVWTHNDGGSSKVYALSLEGKLLATFDLNKSVGDFEDIAAGPGPESGAYLYAGDIGGGADPSGFRQEIRILRAREPVVSLEWASDPPSSKLSGVEVFTLRYPDGSFDAETLMIDPITHDVLVVTKLDSGGRVYRANLGTGPAQSTLTLEYVVTVPLSLTSGGAIASDGSQILLRREDIAVIWNRCDNQSVADALKQSGQIVPIIGPPLEPNGEGIDFLPFGQGYLTISEGQNPILYSFDASCPMAPVFTSGFTNQVSFVSRTVQFVSRALGRPEPAYAWRFNGQQLSGQTSPSLTLSNLTVAQSGTYELVASNEVGSVTNTVILEVRSKPDLRITEAQSSEKSSPGVPNGDWWELTSFETEPVDLSGYRFNDGTGGLTDAFVLPAGSSIAPGESIVLVEDVTPAQFMAWWGVTHLPSSLQVISYHGSGLALSADGDTVNLWDNVTTDPAATVAKAEFGPATQGVSFTYDPISGKFGDLSRVGANGAFLAPTGDLGSPGRIQQIAPNPRLQTKLVNGSLIIEFAGAARHRYVLESQSDLGNDWAATGDVWTPGQDGFISVSKAAVDDVRFYRVTAE